MASFCAAPSSAALLHCSFHVGRRRLSWKGSGAGSGRRKVGAATSTVRAKQGGSALQYKKLGDSDLTISEIMLGTMTFGEQNTEKEAHDMLSYAFENGINSIDTSEAYPIPMKKETQGRTDLYIGRWMKSIPRDKVILATKVCGYSERASYCRDNAKVLRVDAVNIKESVGKSLKRFDTDYIDLLQIHWPDRYVPLFGEFSYNASKWRESIPFNEQLRAFQELIAEGKVRYIGVSNETSFGVMEFVHAAKNEGLPKIVSIQNNYNLLARCPFEVDLVEVCHPKNYNIGLLAYSPLAGGTLSGKYLDINYEATQRCRLNLFPGYMERYNKSLAKDIQLKDGAVLNKTLLSSLGRKNGGYGAIHDEMLLFQETTGLYFQLAKEHGLTLVQLALGFTRDSSHVASSIIGATSVGQLKEDIDAFLSSPRPLPPEVREGIEGIFKRYKDPAFF